MNLNKTHVIGASIALTTLVFWPIKTVDTGHRGVITVGGAVQGIEAEGFHFILPWQKLHQFNVRAEAANVDKSVGSTKDQQPVSVDLTVRYSIDVTKVSEVFEKYSKDGDLSSYISTATYESFKAAVAQYTAPELISKRAEVSTAVIDILRKKLQVFGANLISVDMRDFSFDKKYTEAIQAKVNQEQLKLAAENRVKTSEAEQREKIVTAEAEANALKLETDAKAYQTIKMAEASAEALRIQNEALSKNHDVLDLKRIEVELAKAQRWDGALPKAMYSSGPLPILNLTDTQPNR